VAGIVLLGTCLAGCVVGPTSIAVGRGVYNEVINRTEDEQLLNMIVHDRYDETYGMLAVASVTANIRASARLSTQWGLSRSVKEDYASELVPLDTGVAYEENPTISYVPLGGEQFMQRLLSPLTIEELLLMSRFLSHRETTYAAVGVRSINGIPNPLLTKDDPESEKFRRVAQLWDNLRDAGVLHVGRDPDGEFELLLLEKTPEHKEKVHEFLGLLRITERPSDGMLMLPLRVTAYGWADAAINFETRSVLDVLRTAGECIDVPESHLEAGVVVPVEDLGQDRFMTVRTSRARPGGEGTVRISYRGWWYYIDDADPISKQAFNTLRTLVGLRLYKKDTDSGAPVLTIPVG
jgi:hypothetical protein